MNYTVRFLDREKTGPDLMLFYLEKPEGFTFQAGQYCLITAPDVGHQDERGLRRPLSIGSSPLEKSLLFVTKLSASAFKRTIAEMPIGADVTIGQPMGSLTLPEGTSRPLVFLSGGVGISPFRSMIRYAMDARTGHRITLFYSNQTPEETPFLEELQRLPAEDNHISVTLTMTRIVEGRSKWSGLTGRINPEMIRKGCEEWMDAAYFIVGPPPMVTATKEILEGMNIPADRITVELFAGY